MIDEGFGSVAVAAKGVQVPAVVAGTQASLVDRKWLCCRLELPPLESSQVQCKQVVGVLLFEFNVGTVVLAVADVASENEEFVSNQSPEDTKTRKKRCFLNTAAA